MTLYSVALYLVTRNEETTGDKIMQTYKIKVASGQTEGDEFIKWLDGQGHDAVFSNDNGNYIDGVCTNNDEDANIIMNSLWHEFCN